jgi:hypothetical protein
LDLRRETGEIEEPFFYQRTERPFMQPSFIDDSIRRGCLPTTSTKGCQDSRQWFDQTSIFYFNERCYPYVCKVAYSLHRMFYLNYILHDGLSPDQWCFWRDLNPQPSGLESLALSIELQRHLESVTGIEPASSRWTLYH